MQIRDIVELKKDKSNSAILLEQSLSDDALLSGYAMNDAASKVFKHISKAVLPQATKEQRAVNIYGSYGSGKSHLAVVLARLLRDGASNTGFQDLIARLNSSAAKFGSLGEELKGTFLSKGDTDAKPYFIVTLYAAEGATIGEQLIEALCNELEAHSNLDEKEILPKTQHDVCLARVLEVEGSPSYGNPDFAELDIDTYFDLDELKRGLEYKEQDSIQAFQKWHKVVCFGQSFDPLKHGGSDFTAIYQYAGKQLNEKHGYAGILVVWDEFGACLEDMVLNPTRNPNDEVIQLQKFVETVCEPALGHTIFIGVTHVTLAEYGARTTSNVTVRELLNKISGRFYKPFKIELSAGEEEGYHLIGMQRTWTEQGTALKEQSCESKQNLVEVCRDLDSFSRLAPSLDILIDEVYPLHPTTALTLFNLSRLSQASRTALSFFRLQEENIFSREIDGELWGSELVRVDAIVEYFKDELAGKDEFKTAYQLYQKSIVSLVGKVDEVEQQKAILSLLFLSSVLGEAFQPTEAFLACSLYDARTSNELTAHLEYLSQTGLIWKNINNGFWQFASDTSTDVTSLIKTKADELASTADSVYDLLDYHPDLCETFLPMLGEAHLPANVNGIIHSYKVVLARPTDKSFQKSCTDCSATVKLVFNGAGTSVEQLKQAIQEQNLDEVFYWLPSTNVDELSLMVDSQHLSIKELILSFMACQYLLNEGSLNESAKAQLMAKLEFYRKGIVELFGQAFGAHGLATSSTSVYRLGAIEALKVSSWHDLNARIAEACDSVFESPLCVKAANVNILNAEKSYKKKMVSDIVERILTFDENSNYQSKHLGESNQTSEISAVINGTLGVNNLFALSVEGVKLADPSSLDDGPRELVESITKAITAKRKDGVSVFEIATKFTQKPYGIPRNAMPIFMAFAIRNSLHALKWSGCPNLSASDFATRLVESCFKHTSKLRFEEFNAFQKKLLREINENLPLDITVGGVLGADDYNALSKAFLKYIKNIPGSIAQSTALEPEVRSFIQKSLKVGVSSHETVIAFANAIGVRDAKVISERVQSFYDDIQRAEDGVFYRVKDAVDKFLPIDRDAYEWKVLENLGSQHSIMVIEYRKVSSYNVGALKGLVSDCVGKEFGSLTNSDIDRLVFSLESLYEIIYTIKPQPQLDDDENFEATSVDEAPVTGYENVGTVSSRNGLEGNQEEPKQEKKTEPQVDEERKQALSALLNMVWPLIETNQSKPQTTDEVDYFISMIREKSSVE